MPYLTYPAVNVPAVPTPRLEHYLDFWESERDAARSLQNPTWRRTPYHAEWDINVPVPRPWFFRPPGEDFLSFAGVEVESRELRAWAAGSGLREVGQPLGLDPNRIVTSDGNILASAVWVQRGLNAVHSGPVVVDGIAGLATLTALRLYWTGLGGASIGPAPMITVQGTSSSPGTVRISPRIQTHFANAIQVPDPPRTSTPSPPPPAPVPAPTPPPVQVPPSSSGGGLLLFAALGIGAAVLLR